MSDYILQKSDYTYLMKHGISLIKRTGKQNMNHKQLNKWVKKAQKQYKRWNK